MGKLLIAIIVVTTAVLLMNCFLFSKSFGGRVEVKQVATPGTRLYLTFYLDSSIFRIQNVSISERQGDIVLTVHSANAAILSWLRTNRDDFHLEVDIPQRVNEVKLADSNVLLWRRGIPLPSPTIDVRQKRRT